VRKRWPGALLVAATAVALLDLVAFHGSWNRSTLTGSKVVRIPMSGDDAAEV